MATSRSPELGFDGASPEKAFEFVARGTTGIGGLPQV
jgi:hypothetical protein